MNPSFDRLRRKLLLQGLALSCAGAATATPAWGAQPSRPDVRRLLQPRPLVFPADHGSHNEARTEWWYLTGWLQDEAQRLYGFQVTFFRSRVDPAQGLKSRLAARQLLFAHAALTDVVGRAHWHDQALARWNGEPAAWPEPPASAALDDTDVRLRGWRLQRQARDGAYRTEIRTRDFALTLDATPTQALLLQGERGWSRKGPRPEQASHYYSQPQLRVSGQVQLGQRRLPVQGRAWLDHEWSEELLHPDAVGWDWIGMNLDDGASLTAFRLRRADGSALWAGGSWRPARGGAARIFQSGEVGFEPLRHWTSPGTGIRYPLEWRITTPVGRFLVAALLDAQELDSRRSTGAIYWEGLSELKSTDGGQRLGLGYLELTGYGARLAL
jgi:predicted secreted hydrolase